MGVLAAEMDIVLPSPDLRWWAFASVAALLVAGAGIFWIVRRATRPRS